MNNLHDSLKKETLRLKSLGYNVMPVSMKRSMISIYGDEFEQYDGSHKPGQTGIAIVCSKETGVAALDIDVDDQKLIDAVLNIAHTNVIKVGGKGATLFYQHNSCFESKESFGYRKENKESKTGYEDIGVIDILTNNTITVMPPSQHFSKGIATGKYYQYGGFALPSAEMLPFISEKQFSDIKNLIIKYCVERDESGNCDPSLVKGRNDKLKGMASAIVFKNAHELSYADLIQKTSNELYEYDKSNHGLRLFTDGKEGYKAKNEDEAFSNARRMTKRIINSVSDAIEIQKPSLTSEMKLSSFAYVNYPEPKGALLALRDYILESSYTHNPNMALGAALSVMGTLIGNKISFEKSYCNDYYILLSPAGGGKSSAINAIKEEGIIHDDNLFPGSFTSSQAIVKLMQDNCEILCTNDELSKLLKQISGGNEWQKGIVQELASIWSASGKRYELQTQSFKDENERKNAKKFVVNPFFSFLGATTFSELTNNVDITMFTSGLFPRCLFFIDKECREKRKVFLDDDKIEESLSLVKECLEVVKLNIADVRPQKPRGFDFGSTKAEAFNIRLTDSMKKKILEIDSRLEERRASVPNEQLKNMIDRGLEHIKKIALICAVSDVENGKIEINESHIEWAFSIFDTSLHNAGPTFDIAASEGYTERKTNIILKHIKEKGGLSVRDLCRSSTGLTKKIVDPILNDLIFKGYIAKTILKDADGKSKEIYVAIESLD